MTRNAQHIADRLRAAIRFHQHDARHRGQDAPGDEVLRRSTPTAGSPGEQFARRLREAIDA